MITILANSASIGGLLAICSSLALHRSCYSDKHWPWIVITCFLLTACVLTGSRAALLGFIVAANVLFLVKFPIKSKRLRNAVYIGLPIIGLLFLAGMYMYRPRSADGRVLIWKICTKHIISEKPLLGHGMGGFQREYMTAQATYFASGCATEAEKSLAADNTFAFNEFIRIACEYGIVGVMLVILLLCTILYNGRKEFHSLRGACITSLMCGIVFACFSYPLAVPTLRVVYAMLIIGYMLPLKPMRLSKRKRSILYTCIGIVAIVIAGNRTLYHVRYQRMDKALTKLLLSDDRANKLYVKEAIADWLDNERVVSRYAYVLYEKRQYKEAIPMLERSVSLFPTAEKVLDLGDAYKEVHSYEKAADCYRMASFMLPSYITPPYKLFSLYKELGQHDKAMEYARKVSAMKVKVENKLTESIKREMEEFIETYIPRESSSVINNHEVL